MADIAPTARGTLPSWLAGHALRRRDRIALEIGTESLTYGHLHHRAARAAATLAARGVQPGDRVAIMLPTGAPFAVALHACLLLRAVAMPVDLRLAQPERESRSRTAVLVVDEPIAEGDRAAHAMRWSPGDRALVVHTSGTTADAKEVSLTFGNLYANAVGSALALGLERHERWLCPLPLTHVGGLMVLIRSLVYGSTALLVPAPFDADAVAAQLSHAGVTIASLVPIMLQRTLDAGIVAPEALRAVLLGGAPADPALIARAVGARVPVAQTYGLTEATSQVTVSEPGEAQTAGWALPGNDVWLSNDGEIVVDGPIVSGGGVLRTGDLGRFDERRRLTVVGRKADTIITGGENVAPSEIEAVLLAHPAVSEAAVFGRPDSRWGEAIHAQVVLCAGHDVEPASLREWCSGRMARFKVPKGIEVVAELPRTASGKLLRRRLR